MYSVPGLTDKTVCLQGAYCIEVKHVGLVLMASVVSPRGPGPRLGRLLLKQAP